MLSSDVALSLHHATGLDLSPATVERAIKQRMHECAVAQRDAYLDKLHPGTEEFSALTELVLVPETWFFRDPAAFGAAVQFVLRRLGQGRGPVSILSAPCATGEEPYSLAMALLDAGVAPAEFRIQAMDISKRVLQSASNGIFGRNAFRTQDLGFRDRHFVGTEQGYALSRRIRDCVTFTQGNLLKSGTPASADGYDIIFCRNLLIYFNESTQLEAATRLSALLSDDGILFSGYAEVPVLHRHGFVSTPDPKAFCLRKASSGRTNIEAAPEVRTRPGRAVTRKQPLPRFASEVKTRPPQAVKPRLRPVPEAESQDVEALLAQARTFADQGNFKSAASLLGECLRRKPDFAEANLLFGLVSERNGDLRAAEDYVRRAIYLEPQYYEALCHLAILTEKQGNAAGASAVRQRAARVLQRQEDNRDSKGQRGRT